MLYTLVALSRFPLRRPANPASFWLPPLPLCLPLADHGAHSLALQPNKVYIGGLPEHTRKEDLENCFKKIGKIVNIELKYVS